MKSGHYMDGTPMPGNTVSKKQIMAEKIGSRPMSLCGQIYPRQVNIHVESARK